MKTALNDVKPCSLNNSVKSLVKSVTRLWYITLTSLQDYDVRLQSVTFYRGRKGILLKRGTGSGKRGTGNGKRENEKWEQNLT